MSSLLMIFNYILININYQTSIQCRNSATVNLKQYSCHSMGLCFPGSPLDILFPHGVSHIRNYTSVRG